MLGFRSGRAAFVALLLFSLLTVGVTSASASFDAQNAKKVDGVKATKYTTKAKKRKNKLVAANKKGLLPNNVIAQAPSAATAQDLSGAACVSSSELGSSSSPTEGQVL